MLLSVSYAHICSNPNVLQCTARAERECGIYPSHEFIKDIGFGARFAVGLCRVSGLCSVGMYSQLHKAAIRMQSAKHTLAIAPIFGPLGPVEFLTVVNG